MPTSIVEAFTFVQGEVTQKYRNNMIEIKAIVPIVEQNKMNMVRKEQNEQPLQILHGRALQ